MEKYLDLSSSRVFPVFAHKFLLCSMLHIHKTNAVTFSTTEIYSNSVKFSISHASLNQNAAFQFHFLCILMGLRVWHWSSPEPAFTARAWDEGYPKVCENFTITEKAPIRNFSWLKAFTLKTPLRHYAKRALTPRSFNVKLGPRRKGHKGRAVWLA